MLTESIKSISHLEHLPVGEFIEVVTNLNEYIVSEKVDGASLAVGFDEHGMYTSYGKQPEDRKYDQSDYDFKFASTYRRAAHTALEKVKGVLAQHMRTGDEIALEVLFGRYPNVVPYTNDSNVIVFLQNNTGSTDIGNLSRDLMDDSVQVKLVVPMTVDGETIQRVSNRYAFSFSNVPTARIEGELLDYLNKNIAPHIKKIKRFLAQPSGISDFTNREVLEFNLRKRPSNISSSMWPNIKEQVKDQRKTLKAEIQDTYFKPIKDLLLQVIVNSNTSRFGSSDDWIEGVVIKHPYRNTIVKIVDRELFLGAKEFLWDIRERLFALPFSVDAAESYRSKFLVDIGSLFGFPELGTIQATRKLKSLGTDPRTIVKSLSVPRRIKGDITSVIKDHRKKLQNFLNSYLSKYPTMSKEIKGYQFAYNGEIHNRTLQVFADLFLEMNRIEKILLNSKRPSDIVVQILEPNLQRI